MTKASHLSFLFPFITIFFFLVACTDKNTGELLWETTLPAAGFATPATYEVEGRQYVVIACGGGKLGTPSEDAYVAFALPEE